jgi:hypothetical protein
MDLNQKNFLGDKMEFPSKDLLEPIDLGVCIIKLNFKDNNYGNCL